jgi:long-chain acyl-CoA synthetase
LASREEVYELIKGCVEKVNANLATDPHLAGSQIKRFLILHKELDADDGELTRTRKVRRRFIAERYANLIEALYAGLDHARVEAQVKYEDGRTGTLKADLKIREAERFGLQELRKAS